MNLYTLTSDLHGEFTMAARNEKFIKDIEAELGAPFIYKDSDFSDYGQGDDVIYVRTGGTEGIFKSVFCKEGSPVIPGGKKVVLLTSGKSNSLAASMEILSYLCQHGIPGEIVHGSAAQIAEALKAENSARPASQRLALKKSSTLQGKRLGVVGHPSDWLISSDVDYRKAMDMLGVELIDIPMDELLEEFRTGKMESYPVLKEMNCPKFGKPISEESFRDALLVYSGLKRIVAKYSLDGLTIRCFDLLTAIGNTGCMALAIFNSEGIVGTCEGDVPTMLAMAAGQVLTGRPGFQVNLSKAEEDKLLFAHCTVPLNIVEDYCYDTHFESGIGVAVHGVMPSGPATILKIGSDLTHFIARDVEIVSNQYEGNLCRTQIIVKAEGLKDYMLTEPLGNHHVIFMGHHAEGIKAALGL